MNARHLYHTKTIEPDRPGTEHQSRGVSSDLLSTTPPIRISHSLLPYRAPRSVQNRVHKERPKMVENHLLGLVVKEVYPVYSSAKPLNESIGSGL